MTNNHYDLLIKNGIIVTVDKVNTIIDTGFIAVKDQQIACIDKSEEVHKFSADKIIDAENGIIMPGLVNTHCHSPMALFRGLADDMALMTWLNDYMFKAEAKYINPENTRLGALISCAEMLLSGTTLFCDGYFHENVVAEAVQETGLKGVLGQGVIDFPAPGVPDPLQNVHYALDYVNTLKDKYKRITPSIFCHSPYTCSEKTLKVAKKAANESGVLFQIHVSETQGENDQITNEHGVSPVQHLNNLGILDKSTLLVHSVWVDEADIDIIKKSGAAVSHCPESNMKLASGIAPVNEFLKAGITTGLGTDGCASNNNLDMFSEMDSAAKLQKVNTLDPSAADALSVLRMATINGACAIGMGSETGSLEVGKKADLIIIDTNKPHLIPMYNPVSHIVYAVSGGDVRDVFIDGEQLVKQGKLLSTDVDDIISKARAFASDVSI